MCLVMAVDSFYLALLFLGDFFPELPSGRKPMGSSPYKNKTFSSPGPQVPLSPP